MKVQIDDKRWVDLKVLMEHARTHGRQKAAKVLADTVGKGPVTVQTNQRLNRAVRKRMRWLAGKLNLSEAKVMEAAILLFDTDKYFKEMVDAD